MSYDELMPHGGGGGGGGGGVCVWGVSDICLFI